ncbi:DoxX-like family protein [Roseateles toxinivorans]|uniref:DoxX-like protein n=1 Tax=Roseateles toxinivorans TaxID=270368 RepID=A0A4R6QRK2_9BURK|nr:DoxX-like family protein [Roseateles toxinivorans]TDP72845.1 DoxX-like protein [Roseateles toxinivorans]
MRLEARDVKLLRYCLVFVWLATSLVSVIEWHGQSAELLRAAGMQQPALMDTLILGGAVVDALLGLALWLKPSRRVYLMALFMMVAMTVLASLLRPDLWLHPLGPLTKNVALAGLLWVLAIRTR